MIVTLNLDMRFRCRQSVPVVWPEDMRRRNEGLPHVHLRSYATIGQRIAVSFPSYPTCLFSVDHIKGSFHVLDCFVIHFFNDTTGSINTVISSSWTQKKIEWTLPNVRQVFFYNKIVKKIHVWKFFFSFIERFTTIHIVKSFLKTNPFNF